MSRKRPSPHRRARRSSPPEERPPEILMKIVEGITPGRAAEISFDSAKMALMDQEMGRAERWLGLSHRFVLLGQRFHALNKADDDAQYLAELRAFGETNLEEAARECGIDIDAVLRRAEEEANAGPGGETPG